MKPEPLLQFSPKIADIILEASISVFHIRCIFVCSAWLCIGVSSCFFQTTRFSSIGMDIKHFSVDYSWSTADGQTPAAAAEQEDRYSGLRRSYVTVRI